MVCLGNHSASCLKNQERAAANKGSGMAVSPCREHTARRTERVWGKQTLARASLRDTGREGSGALSEEQTQRVPPRDGV